MEKSKNYQMTFFSEELLMDKFNQKGNPLKKLNDHINWNIFERILKNTFNKAQKDNRGRPHYNYVMMFKILILQTMYQLSDDETEKQIMDRRSFGDFLGISSLDDIPDSKTIWHFKNTLSERGKMKHLFNKFNKELRKHNLNVNEGVIVDASIIESEKSDTSKDENDFIKELDKKPDEWSEHKKRQKDIDAKWTKKRNKSYFGYKDHIKIAKESKYILDYEVTAANVHDSQVLENLLNDEDNNKCLWADSAYKSKEISDVLDKRNITNHISDRNYRGKKMNEIKKEINKARSKIRCRVEHVFGYMKYNIAMRKIRSIGIERAHTIIGLNNLVYNMNRFIFYKCANTG